VNELPAILIIEDDQKIQAIVEGSQIDGGFESAAAASAEEAVALLRSENARYRTLVTDVNLPGMLDGWEIVRIAREIDPGFPIVYMTGAAADDWPSKGVPNSILLNKPFAPGAARHRGFAASQFGLAVSVRPSAAGWPFEQKWPHLVFTT
jgi:DNA-binding response OmpR family regulator